MTTPVTKPQGPTHPTPTHPPRSYRTQPTSDPDPVTNPQPRPKPAVSRWNHAAIGFGVGCVLAVVGLLWLIGAGK